METSKINSTATAKFFFTAFGSLFAIIFLASIILHSKPLLIINDIADFAVHHYFLTAFIALVLFLVCLKQLEPDSQPSYRATAELLCQPR